MILDFFESKESPVASFVSEALKGQSGIEDFEATEALKKRFIPLAAQGFYELYKDKGWSGLALGAPSIFGVGTQTYTPKGHEIVGSAGTVKDQAKQFIKQGRIEEAQTLLKKNTELIRQATVLEPLDKQRSTLRKKRDEIKKNVKLSKEQKKDLISKLDSAIKKIEDRMEQMRQKLDN